jgi:hypothetical protein
MNVLLYSVEKINVFQHHGVMTVGQHRKVPVRIKNTSTTKLSSMQLQFVRHAKKSCLPVEAATTIRIVSQVCTV